MLKNMLTPKISILLLIIIILASGCSPISEQAKESPIQAIKFLDLSDVSADVLAINNSALTKTPTIRPTILFPTPTARITLVDNVISETNSVDPETPTVPTQTPEPTKVSCNNKAEFVKHLNSSPNTAYKPGSPFAKLWLVKNVGTCTWTTSYQFVYVGGSEMGGDRAVPLPHDVKPGELLDLRVNLVAPNEPDPYASDWMLQDENGNLFGIGDEADQPLQVVIVVTHITKDYTN